MDLVSSASDIWMLHVICEVLGKMKQDDLESLEHLLLTTSQTLLV